MQHEGQFCTDELQIPLKTIVLGKNDTGTWLSREHACWRYSRINYNPE